MIKSISYYNILFSTLSLIVSGVLVSLNMPFVLLGYAPNGLKIQLCVALIAVFIIPFQYWFFKKKKGQGLFYFIVGICFLGLFLSIAINAIHTLRFDQEYDIDGQIHTAQIIPGEQCKTSIKNEILPYAITSSSTMVILCPYRTNPSTIEYQVTKANIPLNLQKFLDKNKLSNISTG